MPTESPEDIDCEAIQEFLELKGAVELLIVLADRDYKHDELGAELPVSSSTFHLRRERASDLGLITKESRNIDGSFEEFYTLTAVGRPIAHHARSEGLAKLFWRLQELQEQYNELRGEIPEWVTEHESEFKEEYIGIKIHEEDNDPPDTDFFR